MLAGKLYQWITPGLETKKASGLKLHVSSIAFETET